MLIFDSFPDRGKAEEFATAVTIRSRHSATVYDAQDDSDEVDPFPFDLRPPIVLVERGSPTFERKVRKFVKRYKGKFAGT